MNLNSVLIGTADPKPLVEYYTRLFGEPGFDEGGFVGWQLGSGFLTVGAHSEVQGPSVHPGRVIWNLESDDVRGDFERLVAAGASVVAAPYNMSEGEIDAWIATFADPDGNYFQLLSPMPAT